VNRIWYVHASNTTGSLKATMRLFFTKRDWTTWPTEDETEVGYDFATNYLVQKDYGSGDYFVNKASSTDIKDFTNSMSNPYGTEIYGQYTLNTSTAFDGSKNGITDFNKFAVVNATDIVLPVAITNLKAWSQGSFANISWRGQHETNIHHYEIQKASEAKEFQFLSIVAAKNAVLFADYRFTDEHALTGMNYYRIKIVDKNGDESYSSVAAVNMPETMNAAFIYPNPVQGQTFRIWIPNVEPGDHWVTMYNRLGSRIFTKKIECSGIQEVVLPSGVPAGLYEIVLRNDKEISMKTLIVVVR